MSKTELDPILHHFIPNSKVLEVNRINSGHIHSTYHVKCSNDAQYILQKLNTKVFENIPQLMHTKVRVSNHLHKKALNDQSKKKVQILSFLKGLDGNYYYFNKANDSHYSLALYIENSRSYEKTSDVKCAYEAGLLYGDFIVQLSDEDPHTYPSIIPDFHAVGKRYLEFQEALSHANLDRQKHSRAYIELIEEKVESMLVLDRLIEKGELKLRITHNDPKLSNILFDPDNNGICVIDTDTVMPGTIAFDFGDAVRTICADSKEDEKNEEEIKLNLLYFNEFTKGFLSKIYTIADKSDLNSLINGVKVLTFIMGLRFITDYLNGDIYYTINYDDHNFIRARNQFILLEDVLLKEEILRDILNRETNQLRSNSDL